jgi:hypothetical protein
VFAVGVIAAHRAVMVFDVSYSCCMLRWAWVAESAIARRAAALVPAASNAAALSGARSAWTWPRNAAAAAFFDGGQASVNAAVCRSMASAKATKTLSIFCQACAWLMLWELVSRSRAASSCAM